MVRVAIGFLMGHPTFWFNSSFIHVSVIALIDAQARTGWAQLQVKSGGFDGFLFLAGQLGKAVGEGVRDAKFHKRLKPC